MQSQPQSFLRDEWHSHYNKRARIPHDLFSEGCFQHLRSRGEEGSDISLVLSDHLVHLEDFVSRNDVTQNVAVLGRGYVLELSPVEEIAWIDHRVWLQELPYSVTTCNQPQKLLTRERLSDALKPQVRSLMLLYRLVGAG